jgi:hypothetical protein
VGDRQFSGEQNPSVSATCGLASRRSAKVVTLGVELLVITTTARAAGAAVSEKIFFGRHFKLLKFEY